MEDSREKNARDWVALNITPVSGLGQDMCTQAYLTGYEQAKKDSVLTVMDLFFAYREINGRPTLKDIVKLAKRIKSQ